MDCYEGGEGPPLVLLHGLGGSWHVWLPLLPMLERKHGIFAPTLPGHPGGAIWPTGREATLYSIVDALAEDLVQRRAGGQLTPTDAPPHRRICSRVQRGGRRSFPG